MGKDIEGKEIGVGIFQQKDGVYCARFVDRYGRRKCKRSKKLQEVRKWLAATRCIEAGMKPKTLQTIMGHSNISITVNTPKGHTPPTAAIFDITTKVRRLAIAAGPFYFSKLK